MPFDGPGIFTLEGRPVADAGSSTTPGGSDGYVQYAKAGGFAGDAGLTYDEATGTLTAGKLVVSDGLYGTWKLYTVPFDYGGGTGLVVASPTAAIEIIACSDMFVEAFAIVRTGFDIGKGETITCTIGVSGDESSLVTTMDMATAGTIGVRTAGNLQIATPVQLFVTGSVDLNNLTAGSIDVYVRRVFLATVSEF